VATFKVEVGHGMENFQVEADSFTDNDNGEFIDFVARKTSNAPPYQVLRVRASLVLKIQRLPDDA
jgi:hypothetical protein